MRDVILHAFNWTYTEVAGHAAEIAGFGYGAVLFSPPLYSDPNGPDWWQRYQPKDYRLIRSFLGGKKELKEAVDALHDAGVRAYADIVFNHMANEKGRRGDPYHFPGDDELGRYQEERRTFEADRLYGDLSTGLFSPWDFNPQGDISNWNDVHESEEHWLSGLPDLELNDWVVGQQQACLIALNSLGFDGYRVDAVKHLPFEHIARVFQIPELASKFVFGEALTANDREENIFLWPLMSETSIAYYDFPMHETLRRVFAPSGSMRELVDPAAFGQALPWARSVTFTITHDIPNNDGFRWQMLDPQDEFLANVYVICRDGGVPLVYSDHNESSGKYGPDRDRWKDAWRRPDITAMVGFHNAVHGMPMRSLFEDDGFIVFGRGDRGIVAINKTAQRQTPRIGAGGLRRGRYACLIHADEMLVGGEALELAIPPRQAQIWLFQGK
ncbi:MAG: alpha-amylase family glycosyl hydrolase [Nitrospiraceae bacterium]|nr:alpha-amylase family glycosyl hydrolase [Nitrospiraceae bacterium]